MLRRRLLPLLLLAPAACGPDAPDAASSADALSVPQDPSLYDATLHYAGVEVSSPDPNACSELTWLTYSPTVSSCPVDPTGRFTGAPLFNLPAPTASDPYAALRGYCRYTWDPAVPKPASAVPPHAIDAQVERECYVASAQGNQGYLSDADVASMEAAFDRQLDVPTWPATGSLSAKVRVAVLDDIASPSSTILDTPHGLAMRRLIERVACPDAAHCAADVRSYLALPVRNDVRQTLVGRYGDGADVAKAMVQALLDFEANPAGASHLIVSMSLGWRRDDLMTWVVFDGHRLTVPRLTHLAARAAAELLASRGVLLLGAAGNAGSAETYYDQPEALFPAAWEASPRPGVAATTYDPLVTAVGAVNGRDKPLATMRSLAMPRLVAPGVMGEAQSRLVRLYVYPYGLRWVTQHQGGFSGTSVATAATAATAALVWALRPDYAPVNVTQALYNSAVQLPGLTAVVHQDGFSPAVRRISACQAVRLACWLGMGACPGASAMPTCPTVRGAGVDARWGLASPASSGYGGLTAAHGTLTQRGASGLPGEEEEPFGGGQPGTRTCPLCIVGNSGMLMGKLDADAGDTVTLKTISPTGVEKSVSLDQYAGGGAFKQDVSSLGTIEQAAIYVERDGISYSSEVTVGVDTIVFIPRLSL
ncbi:MAG: S8 family serine peptidase [Myxococcales bacterium]|nr:S8 family serine peptidase [Myxococcales bacterium]